MKKYTVFGLLAVMLMVSFTGCNMLRGAGKDISDTGKHMENVGK